MFWDCLQVEFQAQGEDAGKATFSEDAGEFPLSRTAGDQHGQEGLPRQAVTAAPALLRLRQVRCKISMMPLNSNGFKLL